MTKVSTVGGVITSPVYLISVLLPNNVGFPSLRVTLGNFTGGDVLIGMDVMGQGDFCVTNFRGKTTFSFRIPSLEEIDLRKGVPVVYERKQRLKWTGKTGQWNKVVLNH